MERPGNDPGNDVVQVLLCSELQCRSIMLTLTYPMEETWDLHLDIIAQPEDRFSN